MRTRQSDLKGGKKSTAVRTVMSSYFFTSLLKTEDLAGTLFVMEAIHRRIGLLQGDGKSTHRDSAVWIAISYKNLPVYLFKAAGSTQAARPAEK